MFSLFKSKPKLYEIIPDNYVDIHSHILPGIDDGAKTIVDTEYLMNQMIDFGFQKIIATPHTMNTVWDNSSHSIQEATAKVHKELPSESNRLQLHSASEYFMDDNFMKRFQSEDLLTLKENYVLVEMSYLNAPINLFEILFELQLKGYQPVLAHPERYTFFHNNFKEYDKLKKAGCFFQMNLLSTVGYYGKEVSNVAEKLLESHSVNFVGSDIHHKNHIYSFKNKIIVKSLDKLEMVIQQNSFFK